MSMSACMSKEEIGLRHKENSSHISTFLVMDIGKHPDSKNLYIYEVYRLPHRGVTSKYSCDFHFVDSIGKYQIGDTLKLSLK